MAPPRAEAWERIQELFAAAVDLPPLERAAFLERECYGDDTVRREVQSLIDSDEQAETFIENPAGAIPSDLLDAPEAETSLAGRHFGPYEIVRELGRGGLGAVYLAIRSDGEYRKEVAVKLIRRGLDTDDILRRFRNERQILAQLDHPNIARLIDGGTTDDGLPFFVMEYVKGEPISAYCDTHRLDTNRRLELFRKVCGAVTYAHQNLVIHLDLNPSNILVTAEGETKLLDFGIAKLLTADDELMFTQTAPGLRAMTPEYASPEQIRGERITTASDVYSLGVLLYELLTGTKPYRLKTRTTEDVSRAITDQEPQRPSAAVAASRSALSGDLDNIVLMALRKEPSRRYATVGEFSEDIRRYLEGRAVVAHKDTLSYRAGKFVRRNKVGVAAAAIVLLSLVGGIIATAWQAQNARRQRDLAQQERAKADRINSFLQEMLGSATPEGKGMDVKVSDLLSEASRRARIELATQPEVMASVLMTLGRTGVSIGTFDRAEADLRAAVEASVKSSGEMHPTSASSMGWLSLAHYYLGNNEEGIRIGQRAIELLRQLHPAGHEELGVALYSTGVNLYESGDAAAAEVCLAEAVDLIKRHLGEQHGYHLATLAALGRAVEAAGRFDEAEALYRDAIAKGRGVEGRYRIFLAQASAILGFGLTNKGRYSEAAEPLAEAETIYREIFGDLNPSSGVIKLDKARGRLFTGDLDGAAAEYAEAAEHLERYYPPHDGRVISARAGRAVAVTRLGDAQAGETELRSALELHRQAPSADAVAVAIAESALGECLTAQRRFDEAESLLLPAAETLKNRLRAHDTRVAETRARLANLYERWGKPELAEKHR